MCFLNAYCDELPVPLLCCSSSSSAYVVSSGAEVVISVSPQEAVMEHERREACFRRWGSINIHAKLPNDWVTPKSDAKSPKITCTTQKSNMQPFQELIVFSMFVCLINLWTDRVPILQILTCTHCMSKSFTLLRLFGAVMFVFSRGEKDRKGADCQSRRDCMPCDAFSQEDGCTLSGGVQWCRHTLHACSYGETLDPFTL